MEKCFAMKKKGCGAIVDECQCSVCPFYKTKEAQAKSLGTAYARLRTLPLRLQENYAEKYHRGKMPWADAIV